MHPFYLFLSAGASLLAFGVYKLLASIVAWYRSPLRQLPGPPSTSFLRGNLQEAAQGKDGTAKFEEWAERYGHTYRHAGFMNEHRLYTMDLKAINHILAHSDDYPKPDEARYLLSRVLGTGVLIVEGDQHRQQRRVMNPAFGPAQIRALTEIFNEKSLELCDVLSSEIASKGDEKAQTLRVDVLPWLSKMTLDVIGLAGFNYKFDSLNPTAAPNELSEITSTLFRHTNPMGLMGLLQTFVPPTRLIPTQRAYLIRRARASMARIGEQLLADAKADASGEKGGATRNRDLLSLLVRANMSGEVKPEQRLSDDDVLNQVPTFLIAGHETTSNAVSWALFALSRRPSVQHELRKELQAVSTASPTMEELNALPYLDAVVREVLRLHAPVPGTIRYVARDGVIPLDTPVVDKRGVALRELRVQEGDKIFIPILAINRSKEIWGDDADQFKPERWHSIPEAAGHIQGVWGNLLTFLAGSRACIGYRFSLVEMKSLLFALIRAFEFELAVPAEDIGVRQTAVQRPVVRSELEKGAQMPLVIRPARGL